jgi:hypothetical protein
MVNAPRRLRIQARPARHLRDGEDEDEIEEKL